MPMDGNSMRRAALIDSLEGNGRSDEGGTMLAGHKAVVRDYVEEVMNKGQGDIAERWSLLDLISLLKRLGRD